MTLEFEVADLKHLKNYLVFAQKYLVDQYNVETNVEMAKLIRQEIDDISEYVAIMSNFISIFG